MHKGSECVSKVVQAIQQPMIFGLSANALKEQELKALNCGMNQYLRKPIDLERLVDALLVVAAPVSSR